MSSKTAKLAYKPVGLVGNIVAGAVAGALISKIWGLLSRSDDDNLPAPRDRAHSWREVLLAAGIQGAVGSVVRAAVDRGGARQFERWTGDYPEV
jgi:hypothetical protein